VPGGGDGSSDVLDLYRNLEDLQKGPWEVNAPRSSASEEGCLLLRGTKGIKPQTSSQDNTPIIEASFPHMQIEGLKYEG
jgi:hypothetical protein